MKGTALGMCTALILALLTGSPPATAQVGSAFTYQALLKQAGTPLDDTADFQFSLWDAAVGGGQVGSTLTISGVDVVDGLFTVLLDFGSAAFDGDARYLQIAVRSPAGSGSFTTLSPRQTLTPTPYALYALTAAAGPGLVLPFSGSVASASTAFAVTNTGSGSAGAFTALNAAGTSPALRAVTNGAGTGLWALNTAGVDPGLIPFVPEDNAIYALHIGSGDTIRAVQGGLGRALHAEVENTTSAADVIHAITSGSGIGVNVSTQTGNAISATRNGGGSAAAILGLQAGGGSTGPALAGLAAGTGAGAMLESVGGRALTAQITVAANASDVIHASTVGAGNGLTATVPTGNVVAATRTGAGGAAAILATQTNPGSTGPALAGIAGGTGDGAALESASGRALSAEITAPGNGSDVIFAGTAGGGDVLHVTDAVPGAPLGTGRMINAEVTNAASAADTIAATNSGSGSVLDALIDNGGSAADVISAVTQGTASAGYFEIDNFANTDAATWAQTNGDGQAVYGRTTGLGEAGYFQVFNDANFADALLVVTNGAGNAVHASSVGTASAGMFEISNPDNFNDALYATTDGTGNAVQGVATGNDHGGLFISQNLGAGGEASEVGVEGQSLGTNPAAAGVRAVGFGATGPGEPMAAALEIKGGAMRVTGDPKPADTITVSGGWTLILSDLIPCEACLHCHRFAAYADVNYSNDLIVGDSMMFLTVEGSPPSPGSSCYAQVLKKGPGKATLRVTVLGASCVIGPQFTGSVKVHVLIINP